MRWQWVGGCDEQRTIADTLRNHWGCSRRQLNLLKRNPGSVTVNGVNAHLGYLPVSGDLVSVTLPESLLPVPPENIPLDVVYEDSCLLVVDKPAGLVCHPTRGYKSGTLANALSGHARLPARLITRLDRETSGLVLAAKNAWVHHCLARAELKKEYVAIVTGAPQPSEGMVSVPLGREQGNPSRRGVDADGKPAITRYATEATKEGLSLVRVWLLTGRTHQIRLHMAHMGCPVADDYMYGNGRNIVGRMALHANRLEFKHPVTGENLTISAPLPKDMEKVAREIGKK